jgi:hypothetical protein
MPALSKKHEGPVEPRPKKPGLERTGRYKEGRRSISYLKKRSASGIPSDFKRRKHKPNPMRWRKKSRYGFSSHKPLKEGQEEVVYGRPEETRRGNSVKSTEGFKPWKKNPAGARTWNKDTVETKPWEKKLPGGKPWEKRAPEPKPWKKFGKDRPWKKRLPEVNPWKKGKGMRKKKGGRR